MATSIIQKLKIWFGNAVTTKHIFTYLALLHDEENIAPTAMQQPRTLPPGHSGLSEQSCFGGSVE